MAIHKKFEVSILTNNTEAKEYDDSDDEKKFRYGHDIAKFPIIRKFIEAEEDQAFRIRMKIETGQKFDDGWDAIGFRIYIDGHEFGGFVHDKKQCRRTTAVVHTLEGRSSNDSSGWFLQRFRFAELETVDDIISGKFEDLKKKYGSKGTIRVEVWPYRGVSTAKVGNSDCSDIANESVPEKALKGRAITTSVRLALKESCKQGFTRTWSGQPVGINPLVSFTFEYRTRKSLEQLMIIERPRTPTPFEDRDPSTLSETELRVLVRRQKAKMVELAKLAERPVQIKEEHKSAIKREREALALDDGEVQEVKKAKENHKPAKVIEIDSD